MSIDELLKSLQLEYLSSIPGKILVIEEQIKADTAGALRDSFHKLKGTGATYGFPEVSQLAETVEDICTLHPTQAALAATHAVSILRDIHEARRRQQSYSCDHDPRFIDLQKLLQKE